MTTDLPTEALDGPHLDDEATSAALDGEVTADEVAHLAACGSCRARVERLRAGQVAVAAPVTVDPAAREAAVAAALEAFDLSTTSDGATDGSGAPAPSEVAPRPSAPFSPAGYRRPPLRARQTRAARLAPWLGAAAVLLLLVLSVPLLAGLGGGEDDESTAASDTSEEAAAGDGSEEEGATALTAAAPVDVGDLGDLDAGADLRPVVDAALGPVEDGAPASDEGADPPEVTEESSGAGEGTESEEELSGSGGDGDPAPTSAAPEGGSELDDAGGQASGAAERGAASCEAAVRAQLPEAGALLLVGDAAVDGDTAFVYGFAAPSERPSVLVALVRQDGCELVTFQSYARR